MEEEIQGAVGAHYLPMVSASFYHKSFITIWQPSRQEFFETADLRLCRSQISICVNLPSSLPWDQPGNLVHITKKFSMMLKGPAQLAPNHSVGMGLRYVISITKNEVQNEAGCYQNCIASHFNLAAGLCRAAISQF